MRIILLFILLGLASCQDYNSNSSDAIRYKPIEVDDGGDPNFAPARSIILNRCVNCHSEEHNEWANLTNQQWLDTGLIIRGDPDNSPFIKTIFNSGSPTANMPFEGSALPAAEFTALKTWIQNIP